MQRAFEKIIERMKEERLGGRVDAGSKAIEIVNQVASEYFKENYFNLDNTKLHDCPKCGDEATHRVNKTGSWACGCFKCGLFKSSYDHIKAIQAWEDYCGEYCGGWIPCSERLPEDDRDVLVVMSDGSMMVDFRTASSSGCFWSDNDDMPLAWHELPQPYQPKGEQL